MVFLIRKIFKFLNNYKHSFSVLKKLNRQNQFSKKIAIYLFFGFLFRVIPFIGFRTLITFLCGWLFALDLAALFAISFFVHNPWTIIPIYTLDHFVGQWFFGLFNINGMQLDPSWVEACSTFLKDHTGISGLSLSAFLVGGNLIGISISIILYPFIKKIFTTYLSKKNNTYLT